MKYTVIPVEDLMPGEPCERWGKQTAAYYCAEYNAGRMTFEPQNFSHENQERHGRVHAIVALPRPSKALDAAELGAHRAERDLARARVRIAELEAAIASAFPRPADPEAMRRALRRGDYSENEIIEFVAGAAYLLGLLTKGVAEHRDLTMKEFMFLRARVIGQPAADVADRLFNEVLRLRALLAPKEG